MLVRRLTRELRIPSLALVDADPYGIHIMTVYKYGSMVSPPFNCSFCDDYLICFVWMITSRVMFVFMTSGDESWCWKLNRTQHEMAWNLAYRYRKVSTLCHPLIFSFQTRDVVTSHCDVTLQSSHSAIIAHGVDREWQTESERPLIATLHVCGAGLEAPG